jgi:hypothetical protein
MDSEDRDHFKTIASQSVVPGASSLRPQGGVSSPSAQDQAYYLDRATLLFSCYRRDEAHDPKVYVAAAAAVLGCYPVKVIERVTDPRTGIASDIKFLPNIAEIREACDRAAILIDKMAEPKRRAIPYVPPPVLPGQIDSNEFARRVAAGEIKPRPIGRFEQQGDEWNGGRK